MAARHRGEDVIDFGMGNPDQPTPRAHRRQAGRGRRSASDTHRYSVSRGIPRLRRAICNWYKRRYDVDLDPDTEAIVTIGSKEGHRASGARDRSTTATSCWCRTRAIRSIIYGPVIAGADIRHVPMRRASISSRSCEDAIRDCYPQARSC